MVKPKSKQPKRAKKYTGQAEAAGSADQLVQSITQNVLEALDQQAVRPRHETMMNAACTDEHVSVVRGPNNLEGDQCSA